MTREQFDKLTFRAEMHLALEDEYTTTYRCLHPQYPGLKLCTHVPFKDGTPTNRAYDRYLWKGKVYKEVGDLLDAITASEGKGVAG